jgi:hypothetical protein
MHIGSLIIRTVSSEVRLTGNLAVIEGRRNEDISMVGNLKGRDHLEDLSLEGKVI